ncbi:hypothetical protein RMR16_024020 (plasmid) [Agrobacterium sp. rho-13.3]|uniref:hypothetical protein n=1 Tax=Agrobacterium sp. rho-13.3 TaxID=3072980 RepID=UPI002A1713AD|nr:hypothetical protein [Agrobacterium sp. rho-13.3]MDX8312031.1 hypothetical protein [Agrobacterium sp. rho-13.3]
MIEATILCGLSCAGKSVGGEFLSHLHDAQHIEASTFMREFWSIHHCTDEGPDEFAARYLREKPNAVPMAILEHGLKLGLKKAIITGLRSIAEIEYSVGAFSSVQLLLVTAQPSIRYSRSNIRGRSGAPKTQKEFELLDSMQLEMGVADMIDAPGWEIVENNSSMAAYQRKLSELTV